MVLASLADLERGSALPRHMTPRDWWRLADALGRGEAVRTGAFEARLFEEGYLEGVVASGPAGCTMHASAIDAEGTVVSYTSSLGEGAGIAAPGRGFELNNFLGEPDLLPRGGAYRPGARMMTSMCPTLARDVEGRWMAVGSAGCSRIRSAVVQVLVHVLDRGLPMQEAIGVPRIHVQDERFYVEGYGRTPEEVDALRPYGLEFVTTWAPGFFFGGAQAVRETAQGFEVGADGVRRGCAGYLA
jgi:gamma-glutamyltranspeptidase/glutathione hydrolase